MASTIDYKTTFFEFPTLTRIHGEPTYETLQTVYQELKANASSVPSFLGGGANGHLGLVLNAQQYALVSPIPYIRPLFPGPLFVPPDAPPQVAVILRDQHAEAVRVFREVAGVEQALRQQLVAAIEADYLMALRNRHTNSITMPIYGIIQFLFMNHGKITPTQLKTKENEVNAIVYDLTTPIDNVFNAIENLTEFAVAAGIPYSNKQIVMLAYNIFLKTGKFGTYIIEWNKKPFDIQTWINFKQHFRNGLKEIRDTTDLMVNETPYHANMIKEIIAGVRNELSNIPQYQQQPGISDQSDFYANQLLDAQQNQSMENLNNEINSLKPIIQQMQNTMQMQPATAGPPTSIHPNMSMMYAQGMQYMPPPPVPPATPSDTSTVTTQPGFSNTQPPSDKKRKQLYYCWTHGFSTNPKHTSITCKFKAQGHKNEATAENRCSGCEKGIKRYLANKI